MRYCYYCGASMNEGAKFCPACGAGTGQQTPANAPVKAPGQAPTQTPVTASAQPSKPEKKAHRAPLWLVFVIGGLLVLLVALAASLYALGLVSVGGGKKTEGKGYESPEAAMEAYAEAFEKRDVQGMLSTFAVESVAEHYDYAKLLKLSRTFSPEMVLFIADNSYGEDLTAEAVCGRLVNALLQQYANLACYKNGVDVLHGTVVYFKNDKEAESFAASFNDSELFQSVEFVRIVEPDEVFRAAGMDNMLEDSSAQENIQRAVDLFGAQAMNEGCLEMKLDGEKYWVFLRQVQYDGKWYNESFRGMLPIYLNLWTYVNILPVEAISDIG